MGVRDYSQSVDFGSFSWPKWKVAAVCSVLCIALITAGRMHFLHLKDVEATRQLARFRSTIDGESDLATHSCFNTWVWNKCITASTHAHYDEFQRDDRPPSEFQLHHYMDALDKFSSDGSGGAIRLYVQTTQMQVFYTTVYPILLAKNQPFVLVTGCSDRTASAQNIASMHTLLNDRLLIKWFMQNPGVIHSKVVALPIGVDFHTLVWKRYYWQTPRMPVEQQVAQVSMLHRAAMMIPTASRPLRILINFKIRGDDERSKALRALNQHVRPEHLLAVKPMPRVKVWAEYAKTRFVLSPPGVGLDCHRTWEALILGNIPIVMYVEEMESLFARFPIVRVKSWDEMTLENLEKWTEMYAPMMDELMRNPEPLMARYWIKEILNAAA